MEALSGTDETSKKTLTGRIGVEVEANRVSERPEILENFCLVGIVKDQQPLRSCQKHQLEHSEHLCGLSYDFQKAMF